MLRYGIKNKKNVFGYRSVPLTVCSQRKSVRKAINSFRRLEKIETKLSECPFRSMEV